MATNLQNFPGVYTQVVDNSFITPTTSTFLPGLIGVASRGPFNVPTAIATLAQYVQTFGNPIPQIEEIVPFYLSDAVAMIADFTDGVTVVRVGNQYQAMPTQNDSSGHSGASVFGTGSNNASFVQAMLTAGQSVFAAIIEPGTFSTIDVLVDHVVGTNIFLSTAPGAPTLATNYSGATFSYSNSNDAAWTAESVVYAYSYGTSAGDFVDRPLDSTIGSVVGTKGNYFFDVSFAGTALPVGSVYKISDGQHKTTYEVRIKQVVNNRIYLETSNLTRVGYEALALQDTYSAAHLYAVNTQNKSAFLWLAAKTPGDWSNGSSNKSGLFVQIVPGSAPGSKKLEIFWNSQQVETLDNISDTALASDPNSYESIIALSQFITLVFRDNTRTYVAANTVAPWDSNYWTFFNPVGGPLSMPLGAINDGILGSFGNTGGQFINGFNGENPSSTDIIGSYDPVSGQGTGIKAFEDVDDITVNVLSCPMDNIPIDVMQELDRVAKQVNAVALVEVPSGLNAAQAIDWHNGQGQFTGRGRIDDANIAVYWNWFQITDPFTGLTKWVPPTLGILRTMAFTFNRDKPWYAAAGQTRGLLPEALQVAYPRIPEATKQAMYGNGNSVNPIISHRGQIMVWGDRTMQIAESKLSAVHSVVLVNYIVVGLGQLARQFVFDPNDMELLVSIRLAFTDFLDKVRNERGLENYLLVVDDTNNTADTRNAREVIVDLAIIPTDVAERIFINVTVDKSGAQLKSVS